MPVIVNLSGRLDRLHPLPISVQQVHAHAQIIWTFAILDISNPRRPS